MKDRFIQLCIVAAALIPVSVSADVYMQPDNSALSDPSYCGALTTYLPPINGTIQRVSLYGLSTTSAYTVVKIASNESGTFQEVARRNLYPHSYPSWQYVDFSTSSVSVTATTSLRLWTDTCPETGKWFYGTTSLPDAVGNVGLAWQIVTDTVSYGITYVYPNLLTTASTSVHFVASGNAPEGYGQLALSLQGDSPGTASYLILDDATITPGVFSWSFDKDLTPGHYYGYFRLNPLDSFSTLRSYSATVSFNVATSHPQTLTGWGQQWVEGSSTLPELMAACYLGQFNLAGCVQGMFIPPPGAMPLAMESITSAFDNVFPFSMLTYMQTQFNATGSAGIDTLPSLAFTIPSWWGAAPGATLDLSPWEYMASDDFPLRKVNQSGNSFYSVTVPYWNTLCYAGFMLWLLLKLLRKDNPLR